MDVYTLCRDLKQQWMYYFGGLAVWERDSEQVFRRHVFLIESLLS